MDLKRKMNADGTYSVVKKDRKVLSLETKIEIIRRFNAGCRLTDIASDFGLAKTTVLTIRNNKEKIMTSARCVAPFNAVQIQKSRSCRMETMERLLSIWIQSQTLINVPVPTLLIKEKAKSLFQDLKCSDGDTSNVETFVASNGWFARFKRRHNLNKSKVTSEACSANKNGANSYPEFFKKMIINNEYSAKEAFNVDNIGLFWKWMPSRTFPLKEEQPLSIIKAEPMVVYKSQNTPVIKLEQQCMPAPNIKECNQEDPLRETRQLTTTKLSLFLSKIQEALDIISEEDPDIQRSMNVSREVKISIKCYKNIHDQMKQRSKQSTLDSFFSFVKQPDRTMQPLNLSDR